MMEGGIYNKPAERNTCRVLGEASRGDDFYPCPKEWMIFPQVGKRVLATLYPQTTSGIYVLGGLKW